MPAWCRAAFLTLRELDFVTAARSLGLLEPAHRHAPYPAECHRPDHRRSDAARWGYAIIEESGLSFLGFGIQPPTPSWGNLLSNAQQNFVRTPWLAIFPGLMIFLTIISVNYIGDGLRDAFDPYKVLEKVGEV